MVSRVQKKRKTRQRILAAALRVFAETDYHAARMDDVARRSRTSKGALYLYFPSKEALLIALLQRSRRHLLRQLDRAMEQAGPSRQDKVAAALRTGLELFERHRKLAQLLLRAQHLGPPFDAYLFELHEELAQRIKQELDASRAEGDLPPLDTETVAHVWVGALYEVIYRWLRTGRPRRLMAVYPTLLETLLRSIGREPHQKTEEPHAT